MNTIKIELPVSGGPDCPPLQDARELDRIQKIRAAMAYMAAHLNAPLQVATLAARADLCKSHFSALFKRYTGTTPIDCFIRLRLQQACRLLEETEMSVKAVAYTLGYDDPFYFSRVFKSFNRMAPSQYRSDKSGMRKHPPSRLGLSNAIPESIKADHKRNDLSTGHRRINLFNPVVPQADPNGLLNAEHVESL